MPIAALNAPATSEKSDFSVPENAVFEKAGVIPHDAVVTPKSADAMHLDGHSARGDVVEYLYFDDIDGVFHHQLLQDIEPTLNNVKRMRLEQGHTVGRSKTGEWMHAATVDRVVVLQWLHLRGLSWPDFKGKIVTEFLNDSDNKAFRVWPGRV